MPSCQHCPKGAGGGTRKWAPRTRPQLSHQLHPGLSCWRAALPSAQQRGLLGWGGGTGEGLRPLPTPTDPRGQGAQAPPAPLSHVAARGVLSVAPCPKAGDHNSAMGGVGEGRKSVVTRRTGWGLPDPTLPSRPNSGGFRVGRGWGGYPGTERDAWLAGGWVRVSQWCLDIGMGWG